MVGLIVTCLPSLRPYLRRDFGASLASNSRKIPSDPPGSSQGILVNREITTSKVSERWRERGLFEGIADNAASDSHGIEPDSHIIVIGNDVQIKGGGENENVGQSNDNRSMDSGHKDRKSNNRDIELF